jgi:hypothetical protein
MFLFFFLVVVFLQISDESDVSSLIVCVVRTMVTQSSNIAAPNGENSDRSSADEFEILKNLCHFPATDEIDESLFKTAKKFELNRFRLFVFEVISRESSVFVCRCRCRLFGRLLQSLTSRLSCGLTFARILNNFYGLKAIRSRQKSAV